MNYSHCAKDWNDIKDNKNGIYNLIPCLLKDINDESLRVRTLNKILTSLGSNGYFISKFANSELLDIVIVKYLNVHYQKERNISTQILSRGCLYNKMLLDIVADRYFENVESALCEQPNGALYDIIEAICRNKQWKRKVEQSEMILEHLTSPNIKNYSVLSQVAEQAINYGTIELCIQDISRIKFDDPTEDWVLEDIPSTMRCLHEMTFYPKGREIATGLGGVKLLLSLLALRSLDISIRGPAVGCLTNLLQDPTHNAKKDALKFCGLETLHDLLLLGGNKKECDKLDRDQILFTLQSLAAVCTLPEARKKASEGGILKQVNILKEHKTTIIARTAKETAKVIEWSP